jgi:hypothetical protein
MKRKRKSAAYVTARTPVDRKPRVCTHWSGCSEPALKDRFVCSAHAERFEQLAAELRGTGGRGGSPASPDAGRSRGTNA